MRVRKAVIRAAMILLVLLALGVLLSGCGAGPKVQQQKPEISGPEQTDLFIGTQGGYYSYRIPALIATQKGTVLAFVEGRKDSAGRPRPQRDTLAAESRWRQDMDPSPARGERRDQRT